MVWHKDAIGEVVNLLVRSSKAEEVELIFDRVLTTREINDIGRRYRVLKMIEDGRSYTDIIMETGMSTTAISRLSAKCGFGFQKSSGIFRSRKAWKPKPRTMRYKGVNIRG